MTLCLSPEFSLELFCFRLVAQEGHNLDPVSALDAVAREISAARRQHQHQTKERHFRAESKGRIYCDDLKSVVSLLMNGVVPNPKRDGFLQAVRPLLVHLLQRWDIGGLREIFK